MTPNVKGSVYGVLFIKGPCLGHSGLAATCSSLSPCEWAILCWVQPYLRVFPCTPPCRKGRKRPNTNDKPTILCLYLFCWLPQQNSTSGLPFTTDVFSAFSCRNCSKADANRMLVPKTHRGKAAKELEENTRLLGSHPGRENQDSICSTVL